MLLSSFPCNVLFIANCKCIKKKRWEKTNNYELMFEDSWQNLEDEIISFLRVTKCERVKRSSQGRLERLSRWRIFLNIFFNPPANGPIIKEQTRNSKTIVCQPCTWLSLSRFAEARQATTFCSSLTGGISLTNTLNSPRQNMHFFFPPADLWTNETKPFKKNVYIHKYLLQILLSLVS